MIALSERVLLQRRALWMETKTSELLKDVITWQGRLKTIQSCKQDIRFTKELLHTLPPIASYKVKADCGRAVSSLLTKKFVSSDRQFDQHDCAPACSFLSFFQYIWQVYCAPGLVMQLPRDPAEDP